MRAGSWPTGRSPTCCRGCSSGRSRCGRRPAEQLAALPGVAGAECDGETHRLLTTDSDSLVTALVRAGIPFRGLEVHGVSLEEAFLALTNTVADAHRTEVAA